MRRVLGSKSRGSVIHWRDKNTRGFLCTVNLRRKRLSINRILRSDGQFVEGNKQVVAEEIDFFEHQFSRSENNVDVTLLDYVHSMAFKNNNRVTNDTPSIGKPRRSCFELNRDSSSGLDGFSGHFIQSCWEVMGEDLYKVVVAFLMYTLLPHILLILNWY